jgi:L,D-transpeptidase catalytic domain
MSADMLFINVTVSSQSLQLMAGSGDILLETKISTATNGAGENYGSECTPRGRHIIRAKIGAGLAMNSILAGRRPTGEIFSEELRQQYPERDWILTRILWLSGTEKGKNRLGKVDTMRRYIYIHGAPDADPMGVPGSHGCIKMRNHDLIKLFELVPTGCPVDIVE